MEVEKEATTSAVCTKETTIAKTVGNMEEKGEPISVSIRMIIIEEDLKAYPVRRPPIQGKPKIIADHLIDIKRATNKRDKG